MFLRDMKKQVVKTALIIGTVVIAVALCIAMVITITSIKEEYRNLADEQSSSADLIFTSYSEKSISESKLNLESKNVDDVIKFYSTNCFYKSDNEQYSNLSFLAADFDLENKYKALTLLQGKYADEETECVITNQIFEQFNIRIGDKISILKGEDNSSYKVVGIVDNNGIASVNLGRCILVNINNYQGIGQPTFKVILKSNILAKDFKKDISSVLTEEYRIEYPEGKAEEFINSMEVMFDGMMGFAFLAVILSGMFISMVLKEYIIGMRKTFAIIKAIGGTRKNIILIVINRVLIIAAIGISLGTLLGFALAKSVVRFVSEFLDSGTQTIEVSYNINMIISSLLFCFLIILISSWNKIIKGSKEGILDGFREYKKISYQKRVINFIILVVLFIAGLLGNNLCNSSNLKLVFNILMVSMLTVILSVVCFNIFSKFYYQIIENRSPLLALLNKNNLFREKRKSSNMVILFSMILVFSLGIFFSVTGIVQSISNVADTMFYGDMVVESDIGISKQLENELKTIPGIDRIQKSYEKTVDINNAEVKVKGIYTDDTPYGLDTEQRTNLKHKNTVIISNGLAKKMELQVGDSINIPVTDDIKSFEIIGTVKTMEHDGKVILISENLFQKCFYDYNVNSLLIMKKQSVSNNKLKKDIKQIVIDKTILVKSNEEGKKDYINSNSGLINLFYGLIVILLLSGMLMMINTSILLIKDNSYSQKIEKTLGLSISKNVISQILFGFFIGAVAGIVGTIGGKLLSDGFAAALNETQIYSISPRYKLTVFLLFIGIAIITTVISTSLSSLIMYNKSFKHTSMKGE